MPGVSGTNWSTFDSNTRAMFRVPQPQGVRLVGGT